MLSYAQRLFYWNVVVSIVHLSSFTALTVISFVNLSTARYVSLWTDFGGSIQSLGAYPIFATLIPFPFITGCFHIAAAAGADNYYVGVLRDGVNRLRWIEYSVTNGLMTWSLTVLAGAGNIFLPIVLVLANFSMQYHGYLYEKSKLKDGFAFFMGFIPWVACWAVILGYYFQRISTSLLYDGFAVIGSFVISFLFVIPLLTNRTPTQKDFYNRELFYIILSLTAKLYLDWTVTIGTLVN